MAWLQANDYFDADAHKADVVGIAATLGQHDSGVHQHGRGQLLYARKGCIRITLEDQVCLLPPSRAAWIPPSTAHRAVMKEVVDYRSLYFSNELSYALGTTVCVITVSPLLAAVLEPMAQAAFDQDWSEGRYAHLLGLCLYEMREASRQPTLLPLPRDRRLKMLVDQPERLPPELQELEQEVGASARTISRIFSKETGMNYQQWRQQWRVVRAIELLAIGKSYGYTATMLGFQSESAFVAFFKGMLGSTPREYLKG
ncbi:AraC family transcriptional regulator [Alcaligenaceae bacterium 429]|uniref:AraC family transcriptional regulator n=1 Tax=Paenalcaligenes sp. Me52 TaxID=3392038 RepID=UPI001092525A|nr:AraC family transcriptional regulator [Alcaligenaceae bacterium 429]